MIFTGSICKKGKGKIDDEILPRRQHSSLCRHERSGPLDRGQLRARVAAGDITMGTFIGTASPVTAEVCAAAGFDWLLVDLEHGAGGEEQVRATVPIAAAYGVPTVVRVESDARIRAGRVLDAGAAGVMLPRLETVAEVQAAVAHLYYPPRGDRGVATYNRACRFGLDPGALERANDEVLGIVQIESARAVANAEEIAAVDGVDVLFVGPRDLSHDLGVPGQVTAPVFVEALEQVRLAAGSTKRPVGCSFPTVRQRQRRWPRDGRSSLSALIQLCSPPLRRRSLREPAVT